MSTLARAAAGLPRRPRCCGTNSCTGAGTAAGYAVHEGVRLEPLAASRPGGRGRRPAPRAAQAGDGGGGDPVRQGPRLRAHPRRRRLSDAGAAAHLWPALGRVLEGRLPAAGRLHLARNDALLCRVFRHLDRQGQVHPLLARDGRLEQAGGARHLGSSPAQPPAQPGVRRQVLPAGRLDRPEGAGARHLQRRHQRHCRERTCRGGSAAGTSRRPR